MSPTAFVRTVVRPAAFLLLLAASAYAGNVHIDVSQPGATGQETLTMNLKDSDGTTHNVEIRTKNIPDGTAPDAAAAQGGIVPKPGYDFSTFHITQGDTKERIDVDYGDTNSIVYTLPGNDLLLASVRFTGTIAGVAFDGATATVWIRTLDQKVTAGTDDRGLLQNVSLGDL